jgi:hypothetical protein
LIGFATCKSKGPSKNLRTAETPLPHARVLNLGYDDSRGSVISVYIVNHGT